MKTELIDLMNKIEAKVRNIAPYLCQVMRADYSEDEVNSSPVQFTIDNLNGVVSINSVFFRISSQATIIAKNGELEFVYNENGDDAYEHIIFKHFNNWNEFLMNEVSI